MCPEQGSSRAKPFFPALPRGAAPAQGRAQSFPWCDQQNSLIPSKELDQFQQGWFFPWERCPVSHHGAEPVSLAAGWWGAPSFHNCAVIMAFLSFSQGPAVNPPPPALVLCWSLSHGSAPPRLLRLIPAALPWGSNTFFPGFPPGLGHGAPWPGKGVFTLARLHPSTAVVPQLPEVPPALKSSGRSWRSPCIPGMVLCRPWNGPGLSFPLKCIQPLGRSV